MEKENLPKIIKTPVLTGENISTYFKRVAEDAEIVNEDPKPNNNQNKTQNPNENISKENTENKQNTKKPKPKTKLEVEMKEAVNNQDIQQIDNILKKIGDKDPAFKKALNGVNLADKLNSKILGRIVYHNFKEITPKKGKPFINEIPNEYAFDATTEAGFHTFVSWNTQRDRFYIESKKDFMGIIKRINKINPQSEINTLLDKENPNQIIGKIGNMTEEEFIAILKGEKILSKEEQKIEENNKKIKILEEEYRKIQEEIEQIKKLILELPDDEPEENFTLPGNETKETEKEINELAKPNYVSYFANGFKDNAGFIDSNSEHPTSDLSKIERAIENKELISIGQDNYLKIRKEGNGFKLSFHFIARQRNTTRGGSHGGLTLHFSKAIPNPLNLIQSVNQTLKEYKSSNYEERLSEDGRYIIKAINENELKQPEIKINFDNSLRIPENIKTEDDFKNWFLKEQTKSKIII